jgi:hypothetical protein
VRKSDSGRANLRWAASAACWLSAGRSLGSWIDSAAAMISTSRAHPWTADSQIIRAIRGSAGSRAIFRPRSVSRPFSMAFSSSRSRTPSAMLRGSGGSMNGKSRTSPRRAAAICKITDARFVRWISGSVNSGREAKSSSAYSLMQMPSATRPQRPLRWFALACEIGSIGRRCTLVRWLYLLMRAVPGSIT